MNVHAQLWKQLGITRADLDNPELNIEAGTYILSQIWQRTVDPTPEKVATLYNQLGATAVNQYGKTIVAYMKQRPWASKVGASKRLHDAQTGRQLKVWQGR